MCFIEHYNNRLILKRAFFRSVKQVPPNDICDDFPRIVGTGQILQGHTQDFFVRPEKAIQGRHERRQGTWSKYTSKLWRLQHVIDPGEQANTVVNVTLIGIAKSCLVSVKVSSGKIAFVLNLG